MADERTTTGNADADVDEGGTPPAPDPPSKDRASTSGAAPAKAAEGGEEIVLTEGKTLSDYLEDEPEESRKKDEGGAQYRSVSNVEKMVVQPPGGLGRKPGGEETEPRERREGSGGAPASRPTGSAKPAGSAPSEGAAATDAGRGAAASAPAAGAQGAGAPAPPPPARRSAPVIEQGADGEFGKMFEGSMKARSFEDGETVKGVIVAIGPDVAFLDIGGKSEATIDIAELKDEEGDIEVEVGETIEALVIGSEGGLKLSRRLARGAAAKEHLGEAFRAGLPVEGRVEKVIKGGYEVRVGGQRAFCPFSQMDLQKSADPSVHTGKVFTFRIIEFKEGGKNLILSRRALLQEEEKAKGEETRKSIVPDAILKGKVVSVRDYGAFVDLGGIQGLLHVSEMGWSRVTNPAEIVKPGDELTVKVLRIDAEKGRISLGLKQLQPDPWSRAAETYPLGKVVNGRIVRLQDFGAFIELEPGVEGLAHVSTFPPTGTADGWKKLAPAGTEGRFEVLAVDLERKRIGVAMVEEGATRARTKEERAAAAAPAAGEASERSRAEGSAPRPAADERPRINIAPGARLKGKVERHENYGVFIFLAPGKTGLMPAGESATQRGTDLKKAFPVGSELEVQIVEVDPAGRRIRLSRKALLDREERDDAREFAEREKRQSSESFGSIGDKLRAALSGKKP